METALPDRKLNYIWDCVPNTVFKGLLILKIGVLDAVTCFNEGTADRCKV
jgi:hypothetical protein